VKRKSVKWDTNAGVIVVLKNNRACVPAVLLFAGVLGLAQDDRSNGAAVVQVPLILKAGLPLRVYLTNRLPMRQGGLVRAKLIDPLYAFDRIVVPAGVEVQGRISALDPIPKMKRAQAILNGDFTPLHFARVAFTNIVMPDGHSLAIQTLDSTGLPTLYSPPLPTNKKSAKSQPQNGGVLGTAKRQAKQEAQRQISARTRGVVDLVRGPNKTERLEDFLINKLPYHPQWYRRNTRFDATLTAPLDFGSVQIPAAALQNVGAPTGESWGQVRLLTALSSANADTKTLVEGFLSQPVFSPDHKLILPEGTRLMGRVRQVRAARWFHRGGQLRFTFDRVEPPAFTSVQPVSLERTPVLLSAAESDPAAHVKVGPEGDAKATASKSRLLAPLLALMVASRAADDDAGRTTGSAGGEANYGGRTLGGISGFGLLGSAAAQSSKTLGAALGYYGLAWSVYSTLLSRGNEVEFRKNTAIAVRFGVAANKPGKNPESHFVAAAGN